MIVSKNDVTLGPHLRLSARFHRALGTGVSAAEAMRRLLYAGAVAVAATEKGQRRKEELSALEELLGPGDPVPVAGHRLEGVVDLYRRVAEMLDLLQHRVGPPVGEDIAAQDQHRQVGPFRLQHA